jgi:hypothetical protein
VAPEHGAEEARVLVADRARHLGDARVRLLQQALRGAHAQALEVRDRRMAGRGLEAADEVARAHAEQAREPLEAELLPAVAVDPLLGAVDRRVRVARPDREHREARLAVARHVEQQALGALHRQLAPAELLDQVEREVEGGVDAASAVDAVGLGDELVRAPVDAREAGAVGLDEAPVRGGALLVEEAGRGGERHAGADARDARAARARAAQVRDHRGVAREERV